MARSRATYDDTDTKPKSDAYTGLLALSLLALVASCVILYLDYSQYGNMKPTMPNLPTIQKGGGGGGAAPADESPLARADTGVQPVVAIEIESLEPTLPAPVPADAPNTLPASLDGPELPRPN